MAGEWISLLGEAWNCDYPVDAFPVQIPRPLANGFYFSADLSGVSSMTRVRAQFAITVTDGDTNGDSAGLFVLGSADSGYLSLAALGSGVNTFTISDIDLSSYGTILVLSIQNSDGSAVVASTVDVTQFDVYSGGAWVDLLSVGAIKDRFGNTAEFPMSLPPDETTDFGVTLKLSDVNAIGDLVVKKVRCAVSFTADAGDSNGDAFEIGLLGSGDYTQIANAEIAIGDTSTIALAETSIPSAVGTPDGISIRTVDGVAVLSGRINITKFDVYIDDASGGGEDGPGVDLLLSTDYWRHADWDGFAFWNSDPPELSYTRGSDESYYLYTARYSATPVTLDFVSGSVFISEAPADASLPLTIGMYEDTAAPDRNPYPAGEVTILGEPIHAPIAVVPGVTTAFSFAVPNAPTAPFVLAVSDAIGRTYFTGPFVFLLTPGGGPPPASDFWTGLVGCTQ